MRNWFKKNKIFSFILATALSVLEEEELTLERNQELLQKIKELPEIQFDSLGITDETGRAVLSTGEYAFVKNKEYYKAAMSGDNYIFV